jgi:hypothetical protein
MNAPIGQQLSTSLTEAKMSREDRHRELGEKTQELLQGSLKHVRIAALAAALVPLASVAVNRAVVHTQNCSSGCPAPPPSVPSPCDFITAGGFVFTDSAAEANFGSHGGCKNGAFWGHVNYVDHGGFMGVTPYHVDSTQITGYGIDPAFPNSSTVRDICGIATTNAGETVQFRLRMGDNGEPGTNDTFGIRLSNGYDVITRLIGNGGPGGGNVQLHDANPSSTAPSSPSDCGGLAAP